MFSGHIWLNKLYRDIDPSVKQAEIAGLSKIQWGISKSLKIERIQHSLGFPL
jgi:hypothetical protein